LNKCGIYDCDIVILHLSDFHTEMFKARCTFWE